MASWDDLFTGGGGGGITVNAALPLSVGGQDLYTSPSGEVWLRSGVFETDTVTYPDAVPGNFAYSGNSFSTTAQGAEPFGLAYDGTNVWVSDSGTAFKYLNGVYTGDSFSIGTGFGGGACFDGTNLWFLSQSTRIANEYTTAGVATGNSIDASTELTTATGITFDGTDFWIIDSGTDAVYKYSPAGVYSGFSFSVVGQDDNPQDIIHVDGKLWVLGGQNDSFYQYDMNGNYSGTSFSVASESTGPIGCTYDDTNILMGDFPNSSVYEYQPVIGISQSTDTDTGLSIYLRIK